MAPASSAVNKAEGEHTDWAHQYLHCEEESQ